LKVAGLGMRPLLVPKAEAWLKMPWSATATLLVPVALARFCVLASARLLVPKASASEKPVALAVPLAPEAIAMAPRQWFRAGGRAA